MYPPYVEPICVWLFLTMNWMKESLPGRSNQKLPFSFLAQPAAATLSRSRAAPVKPASAATKTSAGNSLERTKQPQQLFSFHLSPLICASLSGYPAASGPTGRATSTRSATRPAVTKAPLVKDNLKAKCAGTHYTMTCLVPTSKQLFLMCLVEKKRLSIWNWMNLSVFRCKSYKEHKSCQPLCSSV